MSKEELEATAVALEEEKKEIEAEMNSLIEFVKQLIPSSCRYNEHMHEACRRRDAFELRRHQWTHRVNVHNRNVQEYLRNK